MMYERAKIWFWILFILSGGKIYQWSFWRFDVHVLFEFVTAEMFPDNVDNFKVKNYPESKARNAPVFDTRKENAGELNQKNWIKTFRRKLYPSGCIRQDLYHARNE